MSGSESNDLPTDSDMLDATTSASESDPPTPPIGRYHVRHHQRCDPYSLRDHVKPRRRAMSLLKPPLDLATLSATGDIRSADNHSPPFTFPLRDEAAVKESLPVSPSVLPGLGAEVALRLKGTVDKLRGFSLAERIPPRNDQGANRKQVLPVICQIMQESKAFSAAESHGEGEMHAKMRLSKSCNDMCLPPPQSARQSSVVEEKQENSLDLTPPDLADLIPVKSDESPSPIAEAFRAGSVEDSECPAMSPVGFFTTPASPRSPAGRPRSGSQSPYRRTYSNSKGSGVQLKQSVLGKRKAESDDEMDPDKRICLSVNAFSNHTDMDTQSGDL